MTKKKYAVRIGVALSALAISLAGCNDSMVSPDEVLSPPGEPGAFPDDDSDPLQACFTIEPESAQVAPRETVTLDAGCSENASSDASYQWDLGDGRSLSGERIEVQYEQPGTYAVRLVVQDGDFQATAERELRVTGGAEANLTACFDWERLPTTADTGACAVQFDASCSEGEVVEYRWFFAGGPPVEGRFPDATRTTTSPEIVYSWGQDIECMYFRPFERRVQLTVVDATGQTATTEEIVAFPTPF